MAEIYESENLKNYYAPQKPVDTTPQEAHYLSKYAS